MAFGNLDGERGEMSDINVTPLVDVMLVLLIVFMITMPVLTQSIPLELPKASEHQQTTKPPQDLLRVAINTEGVFLGETKVDDTALRELFLQAFVRNKESIVAISADKKVTYEKVVRVLELAQQSGLKKVGFVTEVSDAR